MTTSPRHLSVALCLVTGLLAIPTLAYAAYVALETLTYIPFPGEDVSRHVAAYLFAALLGVTAVVAMALALFGGMVARRARPPELSAGFIATGLAIAVLAFATVAVTVLI